MKKTLIPLLLLPLLPLLLSLNGCDTLDGKVKSRITGEQSTPEEIRSALIEKGNDIESRRIDLGAQAEKLNNEEATLWAIGEADIQSGYAERQKLNDLVNGGIDLVGTATKLIFPEAAAAVDLVGPLVRQGLTLIGVGGLATGVGLRVGTKKGANVVTEAVSVAADKDPIFKEQILKGEAGEELYRQFRKAPTPVKKAIAENKVT